MCILRDAAHASLFLVIYFLKQSSAVETLSAGKSRIATTKNPCKCCYYSLGLVGQ